MKERVECDVGSGYGSLETEYERWKRDRVARERLFLCSQFLYSSTENSAGLLLLLPKQTFSATFVVRPISSDFGDWTDPAQSTNTLYNSPTDIHGRKNPPDSRPHQIALQSSSLPLVKGTDSKGRATAGKGEFRYTKTSSEVRSIGSARGQVGQFHYSAEV